MDDAVARLFQDLGISLMLGLLVGLQRQRTEADIAGFRSFALITVLGTLSAFLADATGDSWIMPVALLGVVAMLIVANIIKLRGGEPDPGLTTELAALVMFAVGAYIVVGDRVVAVAVGAGVAVLLQLKPELHGLAAKLGEKDIKAVMQFALITFIVLPILPPQIPWLPRGTFLDVLSPREIWLMVVLIVGISLAGYVAYKFLGRDAGIIVGGLLGGAVSSTATTVSYARRTRAAQTTPQLAAVVILIASTVVYARVLLEIAAVELAAARDGANPWPAAKLLPLAAGPIGMMFGLTFLPAVVLWLFVRRQPADLPPQSNPSELHSALVFGGLYALVMVALEVARNLAPQSGPYVVAGLSGLTDMDAITLSAARMVQLGQMAPGVGWRVVVIALLSNMLFKWLVVGSLGGAKLLGIVAAVWVIPATAGGLLLWLS
jgi:uncharacterized membrane protein (DUF4010 family)